MFYKEYDPAMLKKLQETYILIVKDFLAFCFEHQLCVIGAYGTVLGAVRHGGFIPWDDDIDLYLPRTDYEKLLELQRQGICAPGYEVQSAENNAWYPKPFATFQKLNTVCISEDQVGKRGNERMHLAIDLFPLDALPDDEAAAKRMARHARIWCMLCFLRSGSEPDIPFPNPVLHKAAWISCKCITLALRGFGVSNRWMQKQIDRWARSGENLPSHRYSYVGSYTTLYAWVDKDAVDQFEYRPFGDISLPVMRNPEDYLARRYGADYMQLPPLAQRRNHTAAVLDFGEEMER